MLKVRYFLTNDSGNEVRPALDSPGSVRCAVAFDGTHHGAQRASGPACALDCSNGSRDIWGNLWTGMSVDRMSDIQHTEPSKPAGLGEIAEDFTEESLEVQLACERYFA
jgi:hypothetical protein